MHELAHSVAPPIAMQPSPLKTDAVGSDVSRAGIDRCIELLNGKSDEEKFAGLLLVTKTAQADDAATMGKVLQAVSLAFIYRLLISPASAANATESFNLYQVMALNVLSSFCALPELESKVQNDATFLRMAKPFVDLLGAGSSGQDLENLLRCIFCMATTAKGQQKLCENRAPLHLMKLLQEKENEEVRASIARVLDHVAIPDLAPEATAEAVPEMAKVFNASKGMAKIDMLPRLAAVLSCEEEAFVLALLAQGDGWHGDVRAGLMELLRNRLGGEYRVNILRVGIRALVLCIRSAVSGSDAMHAAARWRSSCARSSGKSGRFQSRKKESRSSTAPSCSCSWASASWISDSGRRPRTTRRAYLPPASGADAAHAAPRLEEAEKPEDNPQVASPLSPYALRPTPSLCAARY
eukprot:2225969-Rhodomonas_salina.1